MDNSTTPAANAAATPDANIINQVEQTKEKESRIVTEHMVKSLRNCLSKKIEGYSLKGSINKKGAIFYQIVIFISTILTTILIGWNPTDTYFTKGRMTNYALFFSALTTSVNILYNFFDYKDLWVEYRKSRNELESIASELDYLESGGIQNIKLRDLDELHKKYMNVCDSTTKNYQTIRLSPDTNK